MKFRKITKADLHELNQNNLIRLEKVIKSNEQLTNFEKEKYLKLLNYTLSQALLNGSFYDSKEYLTLNLKMSEYQSILGLKNSKEIQLLLAHFISKKLIEYYINPNQVTNDYALFTSNLYLLIPDILNNNGITYEVPEEKMYFGS